MPIFTFSAYDVREMLSQLELAPKYVATFRDLCQTQSYFNRSQIQTPDSRYTDTQSIKPRFILTIGDNVYLQTNAGISDPSDHLVTYAYGFNPNVDEISRKPVLPYNIAISAETMKQLLKPNLSVLKLKVHHRTVVSVQ